MTALRQRRGRDAGHAGRAPHGIAVGRPGRESWTYSARTTDAYEQLAEELEALHQLPCGEEQLDRSLEVQRELARRGGLHHRSVKVADLLIAASAEAGEALLWHYDEDFDRVVEITGQAAEWIAPRGSL